MTFYEYLISKRFSLNSAHRYQKGANNFEDWALTIPFNPTKTTYNELLSYIDFQQSKGIKSRTINLKIAILKHYFDYQKHPNNPAEELQLKGVTRLLPKTRLTPEELDRIYHDYKDARLIGKRNKIMLGFVIYQGLSSTELAQLRLENIDLEKGTLYIPKGHRTNSRTLFLKVFQLLSIQNYMLKIRPLLLQETNKSTDQFFITIGSGKRLGSVITNIIKQIKKIEPKVISFQHIRTSLITNWIQKVGLRKAQYLAGHRFVSSTERYEINSLDDLKNSIDIHHPF